MTVSSHERGHRVIYRGAWVYEDTGKPAVGERPCKRCGQPPVDGSDACIGHVEGAVSVCCGHGVSRTILITRTRVA